MVIRVTLSLDPVDLDLVDRLATLQDLNRSEQFRQILASARPMFRQTVETLEAASRQRDDLLRIFGEAEVLGLSELAPELDRVQGAVLGAMSRLEGALAVEASKDPRASNHGGQTPTPQPGDTTE